MSSKKDDGGPAFPVLDYRTPNRAEHYKEGMSMRDYFAAQALAGFLASGNDRDGTMMLYAREAYGYADAMLIERKKNGGE